MTPAKNLALRLERQADHLDMIVGTMIPDYMYNSDNDETRGHLVQARANLLLAAEHLRSAAVYSPRP